MLVEDEPDVHLTDLRSPPPARVVRPVRLVLRCEIEQVGEADLALEELLLAWAGPDDEEEVVRAQHAMTPQPAEGDLADSLAHVLGRDHRHHPGGDGVSFGHLALDRRQRAAPIAGAVAHHEIDTVLVRPDQLGIDQLGAGHVVGQVQDGVGVVAVEVLEDGVGAVDRAGHRVRVRAPRDHGAGGGPGRRGQEDGVVG